MIFNMFRLVGELVKQPSFDFFEKFYGIKFTSIFFSILDIDGIMGFYSSEVVIPWYIKRILDLLYVITTKCIAVSH